MNKNIIKEIFYTFIAVFLGIMVVKFIIWLLPVILVIIISHRIYALIKRKRPTRKQTKVKKTIKIIEMVEDDE